MNKSCFGRVQHYLLIILFSFSFIFARGQGFYNTTNWRFSNPKQFGFTVLDVDYFDNNNVIAVGSDGGIAKSTDGGSNWVYGPFTFVNPQGLVNKPSFNDVHYITSTIAYAVGSLGAMAKTIDGGASWNFVNNPLFPNSKTINTCWFVNKDTGYIGGQWNTPDSIPKVYFTYNGGSTWDSLVSPIGGKTRIGYINNVNLPPTILDVTGKGKEIHRIEFTSTTTGYIVGSGQTHFPPYPAVNATTCLPTGAFTSTSANNAALAWKYSNGVLTDFSLSKEKLGYSGINTNTVLCNTQFNAAGIAPTVQTYKAVNIINDSLFVMMSFNNNIVVRVHTGRNDSTLNIATGLKEPGRFQIMSFPSPPTQGPQAGPPIPLVQVLVASNPYHMIRNTAGTLVAGSVNSTFAGTPGYLWMSSDTGRNWIQRSVGPQNLNWSNASGAPAIDFAPNGKLIALGFNGVVSDSTPGSAAWQSNYLTVPISASYNDIEFADCNNGIAAGGSNITVTADGGKTWTDKANGALAGLFANITSVTFPQVNKAYFTTNIGTIYRSVNTGTNLVPVFIDNYGGTSVINDLAAVGTDSLWACGVQQTSPPALQRFGLVYRSFNNGGTWDTVKVGPLGNVGTQAQQFVTFKGIEFPSRTIGYACGNRGAVYKTIDAGATWTNISPFPALNISPTGFANSAVSYTDIIALDNNTVFVVGNMFTSANNRRIYKTTDGGANWIDISSNIDLLSGGNLNGILMHDANNGYVTVPGGVLYKTTNGGTSWIMDIAPTGTLTTPLAFAPKTVPASISMANRKMFVVGANTSGAPIMEYGNPIDINVNSAETITNANCTNLSAGAITVNATGGLTPYTYSINGGPFQASNLFTGLTQGAKTITIKDSYCGTLTKTINVGFTDNLTLTTNNDTLVCAGAPVQMIATSAATTYLWTPGSGLSNAAISNPIAAVNSNTSFTVTASLNTCVRTKTVTISIKPNPIVNAGPDKIIVDGDAVTLDGTGISNPVSIAWAPPATITSGGTTYTPIAKPGTTTTYTMTVKDNNNCTSTDNAVVTVLPYCLKVMDAFTPNGDGQNDRWLVTNNGGTCTKRVYVTVFNRYGGIVYKNDNYQNNWDGTYDGRSVADGTYYYTISYVTITDNTLRLQGNVTILR